MKKIVCILSAVLLAVSLCSCNQLFSFLVEEEPIPTEPEAKYTDMPLTGKDIDVGYHDDEEGYHIVNRIDFFYVSGYEAKRTTHSYDALPSDEQRELYDRILDGVYCFSDKEGSFDGEYAMRPLMLGSERFSDKLIEETLVAVLDDHPEIFWMATDFNTYYINQDAYTVTFSSYYTAAEVVRMMKKLDYAFKSFFGQLPQGLSEYEREEYVYRYIINNCTYDEEVDSSDDYGDNHPSIYNLYGVMIDQKAVCEGYSRAFDYLCSEIGVDAVCICGLASDDGDGDSDDASDLHMWNAVQFDNDWYWCDCTWDDWYEDEDLGDVFYYLNIPDDILLADHTVDKTYREINYYKYLELESYINTFVPASCTATEYCYYLREGVVLTAPDVDKLCDGFVTAAEKDRKSLLVVWIMMIIPLMPLGTRCLTVISLITRRWSWRTKG